MYILTLQFYHQTKLINLVEINNLKQYLLTDSIFETGAYKVPCKSQNSIVLGQGDPSTAQSSHPSWACRWHHLFGTNKYPPF